MRAGLARGGGEEKDFELVYAPFVVTGDDEASMAASAAVARERIAFYASTPSYRGVLELHGWGDLQPALNTLARQGKWREMGGLIDDGMLAAFAVVAPLDELPAAYARWIGGLADRTSFTPPDGLDARRGRRPGRGGAGGRRRDCRSRERTNRDVRVTAARPPVVVRREGDVALIVLDRPEVRNAIDVETAAAICAAVTDCQDAAVIVLTGTDPAFCAGLNLRSLGTDQLTDLPPFNAAVAASRVPVIAAVNGQAVTGGFELALMADFIVASERAAFADTHLRVGVYPGPVLVDLPRRVGPAWAREMSLTGNFVDAATALRIGIANHVVPHEELLPTAMRLAASIAEADRDMVAAMREDWDATSGAPVREARRMHQENARLAGYAGQATADGIAARRDAVLDRSRAQRQR